MYYKLNNLHKQIYNSDLNITNVKTSDGKDVQITVGRSYYLRGVPGAGKTTIAIKLAKQFIEQMYKYLPEEEAEDKAEFITFFNLIELFKKFDDLSIETVQRLKKVPLLIIDDFGLGAGQDYSLAVLENFIDERYSLGSDGVTIFTTNIDFKQNPTLESKYSRILSRIFAICKGGIIELQKRDIRAEKSPTRVFNFNKYQKQEEIKLIQRDDEDLIDFENRYSTITSENTENVYIKEYNQKTILENKQKYKNLLMKAKKAFAK